jgi:hypothetical protein
MVFREVQNLLYFVFIFRILKFKRSIQIIEHDFHIEISLQIKIYIFFKKILFFRRVKNHYYWMMQKSLDQQTLYLSKK